MILNLYSPDAKFFGQMFKYLKKKLLMQSSLNRYLSKVMHSKVKIEY